MTKKQLTELGNLHDALYARACKVFEGTNPCQVNKKGCAGCRANFVTKQERCCGGCKYLGPKGCTVQALYCKTWLCHHSQPTKEQQAELETIQDIAWTHYLLSFRGSKQDALEQAGIESGNRRKTILKWIEEICSPVVVNA